MRTAIASCGIGAALLLAACANGRERPDPIGPVEAPAPTAPLPPTDPPPTAPPIEEVRPGIPDVDAAGL